MHCIFIRRRFARMDKDLRAIIHLGIAFMIIFSAFNSQGFIEISYLRDIAKQKPSSGITEQSGYYSLSIIYFVFTISNLLAPPIINILSPKWAMVVGGSAYVFFMSGFLFLNSISLYFLSALAGFGAAVLWTGQGAYIVAWSRFDTVARNSGITWALLQACLIFGGLFFFGLLYSSSLASSTSLLYLIFTVLCGVGVLLLAMLPKSPLQNSTGLDGIASSDEDDDETRIIEDRDRNGVRAVRSRASANILTWKDEFRNTLRLFATRRMILLSFVFIFSGLELTFFSGVYSTCLLSFLALKDASGIIVAYNALLLGLGQILGGLLFGILSKKVVGSGRNSVIFLGTVVHLVAFFLVFLNVPMEATLHKTNAVGYITPRQVRIVVNFLLRHLWLFYCTNMQFFVGLCGQLLEHSNIFVVRVLIHYITFCSAILLETCIFCAFYPSSLSKCSLSACISFFYGSSLLLHWQLGIMSISAVIAALCFFPVEWEAFSMSVPQISA
uniref:UNC93-like protein MFSD11 n=1 Tax=Syphacia muris TaxID=451379 RepID=A0A0N5AHS4_9BILA